MKQITDSSRIEELVTRYHVRSFFDTKELRFEAYIYEKGEMISSPLHRLDKIMFPVNGDLKIYSIKGNGDIISIASVRNIHTLVFMGDLEFGGADPLDLYIESTGRTTCLSISIEEYRELLLGDCRFLLNLYNSVLRKLSGFMHSQLAYSSIEDRLLIHMKLPANAGKLHGVSAAAAALHCSRRQLQRILADMVSNGTLRKTGKGSYELVD